jgi:hypothetical protein
MMHKVSFIFFLFISISSVAAISVSPPRIVAQDLTRGSSYDDLIELSGMNPGDSVDIAIDGPAAGWFIFDRGNSFIYPDEKSITLVVKAQVPVDAANGWHNATAKIRSRPESAAGESGASMQVTTGVAVQLSVYVTGDQVRLFQINDVSLITGSDQPVSILVTIDNKGNVLAKPDSLLIEFFDIVTSAVAFSENISFPDGAKPHVKEAVPLRSKGIVHRGTYRVVTTVYDRGSAIHRQESIVDVSDRDLKMSGLLMRLEGTDGIVVGSVAKTTAWFMNTGDLPFSAKLIAEVFLDGKLVSVMQSEPVFVEPVKTQKITAYFTPGKAGSYTVIGHVLYEGRTTPSKELGIDVAYGKMTLAIAVGSAIALFVLFTWFMRRRKS